MAGQFFETIKNIMHQYSTLANCLHHAQRRPMNNTALHMQFQGDLQSQKILQRS